MAEETSVLENYISLAFRPPTHVSPHPIPIPQRVYQSLLLLAIHYCSSSPFPSPHRFPSICNAAAIHRKIMISGELVLWELSHPDTRGTPQTSQPKPSSPSTPDNHRMRRSLGVGTRSVLDEVPAKEREGCFRRSTLAKKSISQTARSDCELHRWEMCCS